MAYRDNDSPSYWAGVMRSGSQDAQADADALQGHLNRIAEYVRMWQDGQITVEDKRRAISAARSAPRTSSSTVPTVPLGSNGGRK